MSMCRIPDPVEVERASLLDSLVDPDVMYLNLEVSVPEDEQMGYAKPEVEVLGYSHYADIATMKKKELEMLQGLVARVRGNGATAEEVHVVSVDMV